MWLIELQHSRKHSEVYKQGNCHEFICMSFLLGPDPGHQMPPLQWSMLQPNPVQMNVTPYLCQDQTSNPPSGSFIPSPSQLPQFPISLSNLRIGTLHLEPLQNTMGGVDGGMLPEGTRPCWPPPIRQWTRYLTIHRSNKDHVFMIQFFGGGIFFCFCPTHSKFKATLIQLWIPCDPELESCDCMRFNTDIPA